MTPYVPPFYPPASAHLIPRVPYDEGVGAVGTNLEAKRVGNAGIGGAIDVDGITVPFFKGETRKGLRLLYGPKVSAKGLCPVIPTLAVFRTLVL